ncbi:hypothetical protein OG203_15845 [Nocardia sp. NBC_01499]|uniref:hypothetical protein n=1 Tax=Nocardia sp. NBC_01499 TaxID=2903597 RepID=UPI00386BB551
MGSHIKTDARPGRQVRADLLSRPTLEASVGAKFDPNADFEDQLATVASDLLGEAIAEARANLPNPISALTDDREPYRRSSTTPPADSSATRTPIVVTDARWGSLRAEQDRSGHTVLHIDPVDPETKARLFLRGTELVGDRITRDDIDVTVYRGERDDRPVVHIDTFDHTGPIRINLNDGPAVYHGDPATGERFTDYTDF